MAYEEGGDHNEEKRDCYRKNGEEIRVKANEGVNREERKRMAGGPPGEQTQYTVLKNEDHSDPSTDMSIPVTLRE